jgi:hypothetical protein
MKRRVEEAGERRKERWDGGDGEERRGGEMERREGMGREGIERGGRGLGSRGDATHA